LNVAPAGAEITGGTGSGAAFAERMGMNDRIKTIKMLRNFTLVDMKAFLYTENRYALTV
jgi:hypothetical protein